MCKYSQLEYIVRISLVVETFGFALKAREFATKCYNHHVCEKKNDLFTKTENTENLYSK